MLILVLQHCGIRKPEAVIAALVLTIGACMAVEMLLVQPSRSAIASGFVPRLDSAGLFHEALRHNLVDTVLALNIAFLIKAAILVLAASTSLSRGIVVTELQQAHELSSPLLGTTLASTALAIALLASGQISTITGTLAGQVVMERCVRLRMSPIKRRLLTRAIAIVPAVAVLATANEAGVLQLLVLSQVVLSLQLPFAIVPLIRFTSAARIMGTFVSPVWLRRLAWAAALMIIGLNAWLMMQLLAPANAGIGRLVIGVMVVLGGSLLAWIAFAPLRFTPTELCAPTNEAEDKASNHSDSAPVPQPAAR